MKSTIIFLMCSVLYLSAYDFKITVQWNEMAMDGEAEALLQYYHDGKVELIRGNSNKPSSDGNVTTNRTLTGNSQEFVIQNAKGRLFNIYIANILMDEDFATEDDFLMLSRSEAMALIEDNLNKKTYQVKLPTNAPGLIFRAGAVVDGFFYNFLEMFAQQRIYNVTMINAATGRLLEDVNVIIKERRTGETSAMGVTSANGYFAEKLDYGKYTAVFAKEGFITAEHNFEMDITELPVSMNFAMTPEIKNYRIVLTWGPYPTDLDAHLAGPMPEGGRFHIWWDQKTLIGGINFLDIDDKDKYGPETITIYKPAAGVYEYAVHNYTARNRANTLDLSLSGARVDVYADNRLQATFIAPQNQRGNVWKVFRIEPNNQIVPVNEMFDDHRSSKILQ
ncbi:MAG: hypothetical protein JXR46_07040 [Calditrichaceae bacterium]|nr:hypothetical protein [Calditrichaceae bacterium]MBN2708785.1 hypothetical protein [Calditrichaceae bacterium]RQV97685.1 MAG: hypothetical protein EH224_01310 [Calditrichota bacterium]